MKAFTTIVLVLTTSFALGAGLENNQEKKSVKAERKPQSDFPKTAFEYAKMIEADLGVPPTVNLDEAIEIPLYVRGKRTYGNLGRKCDNPSFLGKATVSGSLLQRYEGRTAEGRPLPHVIWISFARNSSESHDQVVGSVQMIGYNKKTGATAFFESCDRIEPWVKMDKGTLRMRGTLPGVEDEKGFNQAYRTPGNTQCVQCHQADPFITNDFINAAHIPGTEESVVPKLDASSPYYVIGGQNWDMRTIHIEGNSCLECHRVGMSTMTMFMENGWEPNEHMPPHNPGSMKEDLKQLMVAWRIGPEKADNASWIIPPARNEKSKVVGAEYPNQAFFNKPDYRFYGDSGSGKSASPTEKGRALTDSEWKEVKSLLKKLNDPDTRKAFESWFQQNGMDKSALRKLRTMASGLGKFNK